jgi:hypothetical protein
MCQSDPVFLRARFNPWVTQTRNQPTRRQVENVFNVHKSIKNRHYHVLCPILSASFYYEQKKRFAVMFWVQLTELEQNIFFAPTA